MIAMDEIFSQVDMFFAPTYGSFDLLMVMNFTGHPGLTFRSGFSEIATRDLDSTPIDPKGPTHRVTSNISLHGRLYEEGKMLRSEEQTSELQSLMRNSYAVFCLKKKKKHTTIN